MVRPTPGTVISSLVHAGVLAWIVFGFSFSKLDAAPSEPLPVDVITAAQFDHLTKGSRTAKPAKTAKIAADKVAPAKPEAKPKDLPEAKRDITPPPPPPPPAEKAPAPPKAAKAPPPKPAEKKAVAKAEPPPLPVPAPRREMAEADPMKKVAPKKPEPKKPEPKKSEPKQRLNHRQMARLDHLIAAEDHTAPDHPAKTVRAPPQKTIAKFDPDKIAALIDRREPTRTASLGARVERDSSAGVEDGAEGQLSLSQQSRIAAMVREQVERCWNPPAGAIGADDLQVVLQFSLNADGSLSGRPDVVNRSGAPYFQAAAESAQAAVYQCSPLRLPARDYAFWKEVQIKFDPRDMRGG
jgi:colicin import membrane protein